MENTIIIAMKAIIIHNKKVLIVKRTASNKIAGGIWEFAGGKLEFGEDLIGGLRREIVEETGLNVTIDKLLFVTTFKTHEYRQVVIINYLCHSDTDDVKLSGEHTEYLWCGRLKLFETLGKRTLKDLEDNLVFDQIDIED
jgi:8-oxo-dGTP diphosphatase